MKRVIPAAGRHGASGRSPKALEIPLWQRIRHARAQRGITLAALGTKTGFTKGYLSLVERGLKVPTLASLVKITAALDITIGMLFEEHAPQDPVAIVRKRERKPFIPSSVKGRARRDYHYESVTYKASDKHMEAFIMVPPTSSASELYDHEGEEIVFVLSGIIELILRDRQYVLRAGDCAHFDSSLPHTYRTATRRPASALVVIHSRSHLASPFSTPDSRPSTMHQGPRRSGPPKSRNHISGMPRADTRAERQHT